MQCLLCVQDFIDNNDLKKHYLNQHRINAKNQFFNVLFKKNNGNFSLRKCYRCDKLIITSSFKEIQHNFINHYQKGGEIPLEKRQFKKTNNGSIMKFTFDYESHKNSYDFADPAKLLEVFFEVVDINFVTDGKRELIVKSTINIQNYQPPLGDLNNVRGLYDQRAWSTPVCFGNFFNDFVKTSLKNDIKKKIILNARTRSSWRFDRFQSVSVIFNTKNNQKVLRL